MRHEIATSASLLSTFSVDLQNAKKILRPSITIIRNRMSRLRGKQFSSTHERAGARETCTTRVAVIFQLLDRRFVEVAE
jgi:hypothetical protein